MKFAVVIEKTGNGCSAYVPDLPGCVAAGDTIEETEDLLRGAIAMHVEDMRERGETVPEPRAATRILEV